MADAEITKEEIKMDAGCTDNVGFHIPRWDELPNIGLFMKQIIQFVNASFGAYQESFGIQPLTPSMVNNYVKARIVDAPVKKQYSRLSMAMIIIIHLLKSCYSTESIGFLIKIGKKLNYGDSQLTYNRFCESVEGAVNQVFSGKASLLNERNPDRNIQYIMDNFSMTIACKYYVQAEFLKATRRAKEAEKAAADKHGKEKA